VQQPDLFAARPAPVDAHALKLKERIESINVDDLSAREALTLLYELKELGAKARAPATVR